MKRNVYLKLVSLAEALEILLKNFGQSPLGFERIPLSKARGRILARNEVALLSSPAFHGAAMDGVAVLASDTFGASERHPKTLLLGVKAHNINTGRPLPPGTDAVIMVENLVYGRDAEDREIVNLEKAVFPWQHVRKMGEDLVATESILPPGVQLGAYELGALAAAGVLEPLVYKKPRVIIIPSGSELKPLEQISHEELTQGFWLPEFNSLILSALVEDLGGEAQVWPIVPDDPELIRKSLLKASVSEANLIVINAGSSAGSRDFTAEIISELGELLVHGVAVMPGKPTAIGRVGEKPVLGIPGYPVSAVISFEKFGQPLLTKWQNRELDKRPEFLVRPFESIASRPGMEEHVRVKLGEVDGELIAVPLPRGAGTVSSLSRADGIITIPAESEGLAAHELCPVSLIRSLPEIKGALLVIGSHDNALDLLDSLLRKRHPGYRLTSAHLGSLGGLMALKAGRAHLAGSHILGPDGVYNQAAVKERLSGIPVCLVRLADREQGLMVLPGNPLGIKSLSDLTRPDVNFVNRQRGSGTRVLLDWELARQGLEASQIKGYEEEEYTHMNVAVAVAGGRASTALGVKAAARALGLDFILIGVEEYDLVIPQKYLSDPKVKCLLELVRGPEFKELADSLGGYNLSRTGEIVWSFSG